ncbi:MAG: DUF4230 domain-containing protein [Gemmatimonadales bacterium]
MDEPLPQSPTPPAPGLQPLPRSPLPWAVLASILIVILAMGYCTVSMVPRIIGRGGTTLTQDVVVERMRTVAKLVSTEATVRDVVVFSNTYYGSTKRTLVVVTGRLLGGIDIGSKPSVRIDHATKRIAIELPPAQLIGVEVLSLRTYDERAGLWNPFTPADRDSIQSKVRAQLVRAGQETEFLQHANRSAAEMLRTLLSRDGYTVDVSIRGQPKPSGNDR